MEEYNIFMLLRFAQVAIGSGFRDKKAKKPIDDLEYRFTYRFKSSEDTIKRRQAMCDNEALEIGRKYIRFYSLYSERMDSTAYLYMSGLKKSNGGSFFIDWLNANEYGQYEDIFINYPQPGIMSVCNTIYKKDYEYSEPTCQFSWTFENGTRTIIGYECHKALTKFSGREWTAWYTLDIPFPYGPWKFGGLPGLILAMNYKDDLFSYKLIGVKKSEPRVSFRLYLSNGAGIKNINKT
jgi:GLPGLI family protein